MLRFSIRDLLWATLVVALGLGWWLHYTAVNSHRKAVIEYAQKAKSAVRMAKNRCEQLEEDERVLSQWNKISYARMKSHVDWSVLDEPIP
jgi:hypothetical protein